MKILYLTFYFEPDLCAGSFRNTPLVEALKSQLRENDTIHVVTTMPNRYKSFKQQAIGHEDLGQIVIDRIQLPEHQSGFLDQINSFKEYFSKAIKSTKGGEYDLVVASSSRLFTAFLGKYLARKFNARLYLDIRDIFTDTMNEVLRSKVLKTVLLPVLRRIEKYTFSSADHINLVSEGFKSYFKKFPKPAYSYFTNGIDEVFLNVPKSGESVNEQILITYAGNIGEGQGLHKVIPQAAKRLGAGYTFKVIGDGGAKGALVDEIKKIGIQNVELLPPMDRKQLMIHYLESDFLFLHLNDYQAFEKVLPSKIFEYCAYDKPIIAGVKGYARQFIEQYVDNHLMFDPGDFAAFSEKLSAFDYTMERREVFINSFSRTNIMNEMASSILGYVHVKTDQE
jgi:hypothetical protein